MQPTFLSDQRRPELKHVTVLTKLLYLEVYRRNLFEPKSGMQPTVLKDQRRARGGLGEQSVCVCVCECERECV
jgi:hypothetical protein